jgi:hypothetical protein
LWGLLFVFVVVYGGHYYVKNKLNKYFFQSFCQPPIDVVRMKDGTLITLDNTRVIAAHEAGIKVRAIERQFDKKLPNNKVSGRFKNKKGGIPNTWGDAAINRINNQNSIYKEIYPNGSSVIGLNKP